MTKAPQSNAKPDELEVFLDYDTWVNDVRIAADAENAQPLPYDLARTLIAAGKARRADPLPGED